MKYLLTSITLLMATGAAQAATKQDPECAVSKPHLTTDWGEQVTADNVWKQYPRPTMTRRDWQNLNGEWNYAIRPKGETAPKKFDGKILVPFPVESQLSGVQKSVGDKNELWYSRSFTVPESWMNGDVNLNFGGVDWKADVWVNGVYVGGHEGAYSPFSLEISDALKSGGNEITVRVYDPTDKGTQPVASRFLNRKESGIRRLRVSGRLFGSSRCLKAISGNSASPRMWMATALL